MKQRNLFVNLKGGLGNQLFQILTCIDIASKAGFNPIACTQSFKTDKYQRELALQPILRSLNIPVVESLQHYKYTLLHEKLLSNSLFYSETHNPLANVLVWQDDYLLDGYFFNYRNISRSNLDLLTSKLLHHPLTGDDDYISIHIRERHGQSLANHNPKVDSLPLDYYTQAINRILRDRSVATPTKAYLFSDFYPNLEHSLIYPRLVNYLNSVGLDPFSGDSECADPIGLINKMANARHIITANSSLSWWAGISASHARIYTPRLDLWEPSLPTPYSWTIIDSSTDKPRIHSRELSGLSSKSVRGCARLVSLLPRNLQSVSSIFLSYAMQTASFVVRLR